jgi:hypothetical protein
MASMPLKNRHDIKLTLMDWSITQWELPYEEIFRVNNLITFEQKLAYFETEIWQDWNEIYCDNTNSLNSVRRYKYGDFVFLYDDTDELVYYNKAKAGEVPEGRVVAAYGLSKQKIEKRNNYRVQSYLGPTAKVYAHFGNDYDKGHFIADASGGLKEINLFPQKRNVNRGWSDTGKVYRTMEQYVCCNPGTFAFSRPLYADFTLRPVALEYGYLTRDGLFRSSIFNNI